MTDLNEKKLEIFSMQDRCTYSDLFKCTWCGLGYLPK